MFERLNSAIKKLGSDAKRRERLDDAIVLSNEVVSVLLPDTADGQLWRSELRTGDDALDEVIPASKFPNQKSEGWFEQHPYLGGERVALKLFLDKNAPFEINFYWLNKSSTKARISAGVMLTTNWEDSDLTKHDRYKVGIDFFLANDAKSLLMVVSKRGNLRVLEFSDRLTNTQYQILESLQGVFGLCSQQSIHEALWNNLALKEVNKKFYDGVAIHFKELVSYLESTEGGNRCSNDSKQFSSRLLGRLLFMWFLRKKGIISDDLGYFCINEISSTEYYNARLKHLFFNILNTPILDRSSDDLTTPFLNGGLFEPHLNDWMREDVSFPDEWFTSLYNHFNEFNFTTDESTPEYEQIAVDPEMLGRVFENLLATQRDETNEDARKAGGTFYTPREIVKYMCMESIRKYLYMHIDDSHHDGIDRLLDTSDADFQIRHNNIKKYLWGEAAQHTMCAKVIEALDRIQILDPACGSGAYPMGMLQVLVNLYERLDKRFDSYQVKLQIMENSIYGVDIEPMAVEISRLRAWLSLIVDTTNLSCIEPLPNLEFLYVCANSLVPLDAEMGNLFDPQELIDMVKEERQQYFNTRDKNEKERSRVRFEEHLIKLSDFYEENDASNSEYIEKMVSFRPFDVSHVHEYYDPKLMHGIEKFDIVIANPPYIQLQKMKDLSKDLYKPLGFETYAARGDIYSLFYERGVNLLVDRGTLCYITSNKWMRAAYGEKLRDFFLKNGNPYLLIDFAGQKIFESATVDVNILFLAKEPYLGATRSVKITDGTWRGNLGDYITQNAVDNTFKTGSSWTILSPIEQSIKQKIEAVGVPLKEWDIQINYGIKTGCNDAFIIDGATKDRLIAEDPKSAEIIRPILRGRDIKRYGYNFADQWLIATFPAKNYDINAFPAVRDYLASGIWSDDVPHGYGKLRLEQTGKTHKVGNAEIKSRKTTGNNWFETQDQIAYWDDFSKQKIYWSDIATKPKFMSTDEEVLINNTCYMIAGAPAWMVDFLNSKISSFYIPIIASSLGGEGVRYFKQFIEAVPVPQECPLKNIQEFYSFTDLEMRLISSFES